MTGQERLDAVDRSTPAMFATLPQLPKAETMLIRLLRIAVVGLGQATEPAFKRADLTESTFHVLCLLMASEGGAASPSELSELVGASRANMSRIVDSLAADGLATRESLLSDARRATVRISARGEAVTQDGVDALAEPVGRAFALLDGDELVELDRLLRKLVLSFDQSADIRGEVHD